MPEPETNDETRKFSLTINETSSATQVELEMGQPGSIKFEVPPRPKPRVSGNQVSWGELRQKIRERVAEEGKEKFWTKEATLLGAWAYVNAVGNLAEDFGTAEIKVVLRNCWDVFQLKNLLHTGDLKDNPWTDQLGDSKRYRLNEKGLQRAEELMKELVGAGDDA